jgi:hypothetical protein
MAILKCTCLFLFPVAIAICADPGSISGRILSAAGAGAPVPKALVQATNSDTKASFKATSDGDGKYELGGLPAGTYELSTDKMLFFRPFHEGGVQVAAGKVTTLDIRLDDINLNTLGDGGEQFAPARADEPVLSGPAPRASDGKPDLSGVWQPTTPKLFGDEPEPLPEAEAVSKQRFKRGLSSAFASRIAVEASRTITYYSLLQTQ